MNVLEARKRMQECAAAAKSIAEDSVLTLPEKKERLDKVEADLKDASAVIALDEQAKRLMVGGEANTNEAPAGRSAKTIGEQVIASDAYRSMLGAKGARFSASVDVKTVGTIDEGTSVTGTVFDGMGGAAVVPQYLPGIVDLRFPPLLVADLFAQGTTDSALISYVKETAFQNSAAGTAEKTKKPQSDDSLARVNAQVGKIAHFLKVTDEMAQDVPAYVSFLNNRLILGVQQKEQVELLQGSGYPSVPGILGQSGLATAVAANGASQPIDIEAVFAQLTAIRTTAWLEPDAILVNPSDWQSIKLRKDSNGQYFSGGPFTGSYGNGGYSNVDALWGVRVVVTPAVPAKTILVGAFKEGAQIFRRQGVTVEMTNSNQDDFENNLITVRAEERLALAVYRPGAFGKVTLA